MSTEQIEKFELSKEYLEQLQQAIDAKDNNFILNTMEGVNPADISQVLDEFNTEESKYVIDLLDDNIGAQIIIDLDEDTRVKFLKAFSPDEISGFINELDSDDAVDILNELDLKVREQVLAGVTDKEKANHILDLLRYEEDVAGGLMAKELIKANVNWSVVQCIDEIRRQAEKVQKIYSVYVVDNEARLLGRVSLKRIILAEDNVKIKDIYEPDIVSVETFMDEVDVAEIMKRYDLDAVPVVNVHGKLVGRITIDDIVDVITELADEERQLMSGLMQDIEEDDSVWMLTKARLPWLVIGVVGAMFGAQFISVFENEISIIPAMAFFIPLITATGGNVGIQSSTLVVQSLASKSAFDQNILRRIAKVLFVAMLNGVTLASLVFSINMILGYGLKLGLVVSIALFSVVLLASFMGTATPLVLNRLGVNPAMASGPFITTANDLLGLLVYFYVAHLLYF